MTHGPGKWSKGLRGSTFAHTTPFLDFHSDTPSTTTIAEPTGDPVQRVFFNFLSYFKDVKPERDPDTLTLEEKVRVHEERKDK